MAGAIEFERALAVLIIVPEFFLPLRPLATRYHSGAAGRTARDGCSRSSTSRCRATRPRRRRRRAVEAPRSPCRPDPMRSAFAGVTVTYPGRGNAGPRRARPRHPGRRAWSPRRARPAPASRRSRASCCASSSRTRARSSSAGRRSPRSTSPPGARASPGSRSAPHLFHGTIADNIRLARPGRDGRGSCEPPPRGAAPTFIDGLPDGFDTPSARTGSGSAAGSGSGSRSPARSCRGAAPGPRRGDLASRSRRARTLIATTLAGPSGARTVIVVSHRLRLASDADIVAVVDEGRVVESGAAGELLRGPAARPPRCWTPRPSRTPAA